MPVPTNGHTGMQGEILAFLQANPHAYSAQDIALCLSMPAKKVGNSLFKLRHYKRVAQHFVAQHLAVYAADAANVRSQPPAHQMVPRRASPVPTAVIKRVRNRERWERTIESDAFHKQLVGTQPPPLDLVTLFQRNGLYP